MNSISSHGNDIYEKSGSNGIPVVVRDRSFIKKKKKRETDILNLAVNRNLARVNHAGWIKSKLLRVNSRLRARARTEVDLMIK